MSDFPTAGPLAIKSLMFESVVSSFIDSSAAFSKEGGGADGSGGADGPESRVDGLEVTSGSLSCAYFINIGLINSTALAKQNIGT